jgi:hypothetical protein
MRRYPARPATYERLRSYGLVRKWMRGSDVREEASAEGGKMAGQFIRQIPQLQLYSG